MGKENEVMILDINAAEARKRLKQLNAKPIGRYKFKRIEFLLKGKVKSAHSWGRVRTDGKETTITMKEMKGAGGYSAMTEYEIKTDNFKNAVRLITRLIDSDLIIYFENQREAYELGKAYVTIDKWPEIPAYMIEAPSMQIVKYVYRKLGIKGKFAGNASIHKVYERYGLNFREVMKRNAPKLRELLTE